MKKIKTVLIGMGKIGYTGDLKNKKKIQTHYKALNENKYIDLICVVENKKINLKNKKVKIYKNINKIKFLDFELAVVAVPTKDHFKVLKFLINLKQSKMILCEKPFTDDYKKAKQISTLSKKKNKYVYVNYFRRTIPSFIKLKNYLKKYNKVKKMNVFYSKNLIRNGCHFIDLAHFLFGKIQFDQVNKFRKELCLKSNNAFIKLNFINNKKNDNFFEINFDNKTIIVDKKTRIFEKVNTKKKQIFKNSRNEIDIFQKISLNTFIIHYLNKSQRNNGGIYNSEDLLNTLNIIKKSKL